MGRQHGWIFLAYAFLLSSLLLLWSSPAHAGGGLFYRSASIRRLTPIAVTGEPAPGSSAFSGSLFTGLTRGSPASTGACGGASVVAFCARANRPFSNNTGIFLYDATTGTLHDVVLEGDVTPIGGTWFDCGTVPPEVVIDSTTCTAHVIFPGSAQGVASTMDTGIFDATFSLPGLSLGAITTLVQEGVTSAPAPFPSGAVFGDLSRAPLSAAYGTGPGVVVAFNVSVSGGGVTFPNNSGVFSWTAGGTLTHARAGDPTCAPPWPGAGSVYDRFDERMRPGAAALAGPAVTFSGHSRGANAHTNSAIVRNELGCGGTNVLQAVEGSATPIGGTYGDFDEMTELASNAAGDTVFVANVVGLAATTRVLIRSNGDAVARDQQADTALGAPLVNFLTVLAPAINGAGDVVFTSRLSGIGSGLVLYDTATILPELLTRGRSAQIDDLGNMAILVR